jgi:hypothetical protein
MVTEIRIQPLAASTGALAVEYARLSRAVEELQERLKMSMTQEQSRSVQDRLAETRAAIADLERQDREQQAAERRAAAEAAEAARRAALTGHARTLVDAHQAKIEALKRAEAQMAATVGAINEALAAEALERGAATAMAAELNVRSPLGFSADEMVRRLAENICAHLARISACRMRRLGYLALPDDPGARGSETWASREERATAGAIDALLSHAEENGHG